jgi:regulator of telomere elongation helicase 1
MHRLLARRVRSLLLTSGTLAPMDSFAAELQLGFKHTLENPHIIEPHQVGVCVGVGGGACGAWLTSSMCWEKAQPARTNQPPTSRNQPPPSSRQVWVGVVPSGPTGAGLNSSYNTRGSPRYKDDLGNALVNFARVVPDGLLVFFPAYSVMAACIEHWKQPAGGWFVGVVGVCGGRGCV